VLPRACQGKEREKDKQLLGDQGCEPWKLPGLSRLVNPWAVSSAAAPFTVSAAPLEGEGFAWLLAFQQMETPGLCAALQLLLSRAVKAAGGFDVK